MWHRHEGRVSFDAGGLFTHQRSGKPPTRLDWDDLDAASITAIANHVGRDRKTVRHYLNGKREPGVRRRATDPFVPFVEYVTARLNEDPHLWAVTLLDELEALGFTASYQTLTRQIRARSLRPVCTDCTGATGRANAVIAHPAGEETQWDWLDLPDPPTSWGWGSMAH